MRPENARMTILRQVMAGSVPKDSGGGSRSTGKRLKHNCSGGFVRGCRDGVVVVSFPALPVEDNAPGPLELEAGSWAARTVWPLPAILRQKRPYSL